MDPLRPEAERSSILGGWLTVANYAESIDVWLGASDCELIRRTLLQYLKDGPHNPTRYFYRVTLALDTSP